MNIQVGAGGVRLAGFKNVDIRKVEGVDFVGDAASLKTIKDGEVDTLFGHAVFEHLFLGHHLIALREWKRILSPGGLIVQLGIPDFSVVARLYLNGAAGIVGDRFDLLNVYRYTHGEPEHASDRIWSNWKATEGGAPQGWIPQLHKCLFDQTYVRDLIVEAGLRGVVFNYNYPGEDHPLCLGFIATVRDDPPRGVGGIQLALQRIPDLKRFVNVDTITINEGGKSRDGMADYARRLADSPAPPRLRRAARSVLRWLKSFF